MSNPMPTCQYDSGSATGNRPLCDRQADRHITYRGYGGEVVAFVCPEHERATYGQVFPAHAFTEYGPASCVADGGYNTDCGMNAYGTEHGFPFCPEHLSAQRALTALATTTPEDL